jgi:hypothetical protein
VRPAAWSACGGDRGTVGAAPATVRSRTRFRLAAALLAACSGGGAPGPPLVPDASLAASKLAVVAVAIATGHRGRSFFDNFLACPRAGVIDYRDTPRGRQANVVGCDTGDGVVLDGAIEVQWPQAGGDPRALTGVEVVGPVRARVEGAGAVTIDRATVTGLSFTGLDEPTVDRLVVAPVRVTALGVTAPLDPRAAPAAVFQPAGRGLASRPNAAGALDALDSADVRRVALHDALRLASILFDETLESARGEHTHTLPCGTLHVRPDPATRLPHMDAVWTACDLGGGTFAGGTFTVDWSRFDAPTGEIAMVVAGQLTLGGGVPRVELTRLEWSIAGIAGFPATARVAGRLVAGAGAGAIARPFAIDVLVDD